MPYAEVAVGAPAPPGKTFSYSVPDGVAVRVGHAVQVPFGPRQLPGFVFETPELPSYPETRDIARVIDAEPWLAPWQIGLATWISRAYHTSMYAAASVMIPPGYRQKVVAVYSPVKDISEDVAARLDEAPAKALRLIRERDRANERDVEQLLGKRAATRVIGQLVRRKLIRREWDWQRPSVGPKLRPLVRLTAAAPEAMEEARRLSQGRAKKQGALLSAVAESPEAQAYLSDLNQRFGPSRPSLSALESRGLIVTERVRVDRDPLAGRHYPRTRPPTLTTHQEEAWRELTEGLVAAGAGPTDDPNVWLLFGVTGSGKTELYLRALDQVVKQGKRGIVLVPEIALTPQTIERFAGRFPGRVAVLHSHLTPGQQFDEWWRIREGEFDVVIGSRGAAFAPQPDLGLIVLDEEHEWTFKQQGQQPLYHARDVAIKTAELTGAAVILGSATPSIESFHRAQSGRYRLLELPQRIVTTQAGDTAESAALPTVQVVDLREELKAGNRSIFSRALTLGIKEALAAKQQVILFLNRRGSSTFVQCRDCGYVARCSRCDATLTYHADQEMLRCHQCNAHTRQPVRCPECWGPRIRYTGLGTQRLEEEVQKAFPMARTLRWDRDVTQGRDAHEDILRKFQAHQADVLIGTQMLAKGLHLPSVTLVGVVNADIGLYLPDFRAPERVFQVLCQVAGRSGRGPAGGRVIIQTYRPEHYAVAAAAVQDYRAFYQQELGWRMDLGMPPFSRLARLVYQHTNGAYARRETERIYQHLRQQLEEWGYPSTKLIGPAPAPYERIRGRFRWHVVIQGPDPNQLLESLPPLPEGWQVDVDPVSLL